MGGFCGVSSRKFFGCRDFDGFIINGVLDLVNASPRQEDIAVVDLAIINQRLSSYAGMVTVTVRHSH